MYDPYADFPAYFNPLALLNSALSVSYGHPDAFYDALDPAGCPRYVTTKPNGGGGTDTYVLYSQPASAAVRTATRTARPCRGRRPSPNR